jgi:hypothetical protein
VKLPLVQILVVVANIQMRTLKTEVEKGSLRFKVVLFLLSTVLSKGNPVNIPEPGYGCCGNANELGDASKSPGKSSLFFLTN